MRLSKVLSFLYLGTLFILLNACGGDETDPTPAATILAPTVSGLFQPEGQLTVTFSITGTYNEGNVFTAQLSDGTGSFNNPINIGTLTSLTAGTINATLPASIANGNAYRIRVVASAPAVIGADNGSDLSIAAPTLSIASFDTAPQTGTTYIAGRNVAIVTAFTGTFAANNVFRIQLSDGSGSFTNATNLYEGATLSPTQTVTLPSNIAVGSGYKFRITSTNPVATSATTAAFSVVELSFAVPTITGNVVPGGTTTISTTITNGPILSGNYAFKIQLSDASGNFATPTDLISLPNPSASPSFNITLPINTPPGSGYKLRAVFTTISGSYLYTGPSTSALTIGAKPTLTITEANPVFTRMYTAQTNTTYHLYYVFTVQGTGSFNPNTTFAFQAQGAGQPFGSPSILYGGLLASTLSSNGTVTAFVGLRGIPAGPVKFRVIALGHEITSNEKSYSVFSTAVTGLTATIDNVSYNFNTNPTVSGNASTASGANNQSISVIGNAAYNLNGANSIRAFVNLPLTNETVATGARTVGMTVYLFNGSSTVAGYTNSSVSTTISGNATSGFSGSIGSITLTRFTGSGPTTLTVQSGSFSFTME